MSRLPTAAAPGIFSACVPAGAAVAISPAATGSDCSFPAVIAFPDATLPVSTVAACGVCTTTGGRGTESLFAEAAVAAFETGETVAEDAVVAAPAGALFGVGGTTAGAG